MISICQSHATGSHTHCCNFILLNSCVQSSPFSVHLHPFHAFIMLTPNSDQEIFHTHFHLIHSKEHTHVAFTQSKISLSSMLLPLVINFYSAHLHLWHKPCTLYFPLIPSIDEQSPLKMKPHFEKKLTTKTSIILSAAGFTLLSYH